MQLYTYDAAPSATKGNLRFLKDVVQFYEAEIESDDEADSDYEVYMFSNHYSQ